MKDNDSSLDRWIVYWLFLCAGLQLIASVVTMTMIDYPRGIVITLTAVVWVWMVRVMELLKGRS